MGFKEFLSEQMPTSQALDLLGLSGTYDEKELKRAYRRASNKAHPDKGGSVDQQQLVNAAYKSLQGTEGGQDPMSKFRQRQEEDKERAKIAEAYVIQLFNQYFQPRDYINYFKEMSGKEFTHERSVRANSSFGSHVTVTYRFTSEDNKTFFDLSFWCTMRFTKSLGSASESTGLDSMSVNTSVLHERKKYKMSRRDVSFDNSVQAISDPKKNFPQAKLKKVFSVGSTKRKPVKRADYLLAFSKELNATMTKDYIRIPLKNDYEYVMSRMVFMRQGQYISNGLYTTKPLRREQTLTTMFIEYKDPEYLDMFIDGLKDIQRKSTPQSIERDLQILQKRLERKFG